MAQDIRDLLKGETSVASSLREGHLSRFEQLLEERSPLERIEVSAPKSKRGMYLWIKIAAVLILAGGIVMMVYTNAFAKADTTPSQIVETSIEQEEVTEPDVFLSAISPEFKRVEDYYLASVNLELARLEITDENKELIDAFMQQLSNLDSEYKRLNQEITESGVSEEMVNAMIENLKLRVELMVKLKAKLKEMKDSETSVTDQQTV